MTLKIRAVNYTSADDDGNKIYTGYTLQTATRNRGWVDIPVTEIYVDSLRDKISKILLPYSDGGGATDDMANDILSALPNLKETP
jgi:hypothetical protein